LPKKHFWKSCWNLWHIQFAVVEGLRKGKSPPAYADAKGGENMDDPTRTQWQIRCAFNGFCKRTLRHEAINAHKQIKRQQLREVTFSDLTPHDENQFIRLMPISRIKQQKPLLWEERKSHQSYYQTHYTACLFIVQSRKGYEYAK